MRALPFIVLFALAFFVIQRLTFLLRFPPYEWTTIWVPGALTFSALLITPVRQWWQFYIGLSLGVYLAFLGDSQIPAPVALLSAQFHFAAVALGVSGMRRSVIDVPFSTVASMLVFVLAAGVVVPLATSAPVELMRWASGAEGGWSSAVRSFLCVALGVLIASPAFATMLSGGLVQIRNSSRKRIAEAIALAIVLLVVGQAVFTAPAGAGSLPALIYAPIPILLWAALRFEVAGASWALLVVAYQSTWNAIKDRGPFIGGTAVDHVLHLQLFLSAVSLPLLFVAVGVRERRRAYSLMVREIDERRRMEDRFQLVVESTPSAMLMVNDQGNMVLVNRQAERLFGFPREKLIGQPVEMLVPERLRNHYVATAGGFLAAPLSRMMGGGAELYGLRRDGHEFPLEMGLTPVETGQGLLVLVAITDITERKRAEEVRQELVHASRLAMLSEFTASIAHEINQPLGAILSNTDAAEMLLDHPAPPLDEIRRILVDIRNDDLRASGVIRGLRTLLKRGEVERQSVEINQIVKDVMVILRAEARKRGVELCSNLAPNLPTVMADRVHLQQVLLNLIVNGMEAMFETDGAKQVTIATAYGDGCVQVSVTDTGPGVCPDRIPRLFDRFFSTKKDGMGMGLAICQSLVEGHGGRIGVASQLGQGATFHFNLPIELKLAANDIAARMDCQESRS